LGIDYDSLSRINSKLIVCSLSGFGQTGPYRGKSGHDLNYLGVAGALSLMGEPFGPPTHSTGIAVADFNASMFTVLSIVSAVLARERSERGQYLDVSMTDCMASWMGRYVAESASDKSRNRQAMMSRPGYDVYRCADGTYLTLGCVENVFWQNLISTLTDDHELRSFRSPESRDANQEKVETLLTNLIAQESRDHWIELFEAADVPAAPVNLFGEILDDPQLRARELFIDNPDSPGVPYQKFPVVFSDVSSRKAVRAPELGEHTDEVLREAGLSQNDIDELRRAGAF
jgi:crotonobetainyl-CoA:carnitine CoA-transferase CaiB-like acyl-CoA transferase